MIYEYIKMVKENEWKNEEGYLLDAGFDDKEYGKERCWHWGINSHARIGVDYRNESKASIIELNCELIPPPTMHSCRVNLEINGMMVDSVVAPRDYKVQFWAQPGKIHEICFWVENDPISVTGDKRRFYFLLQNPGICKRELDLPKDETLLLLQNDLKRLLRKFIEICDKNQLKYVAMYGTLLGAIRHTDFVPWDDDLDVAMPRDDYNRFLSIVKQYDNKADYYILNSEDCEDYFTGGYARFGMVNSTFVRSGEARCKYPHGVTLDILPLDYVPEDFDVRINQQKQIQRWQRALMFEKENRLKMKLLQDEDKDALEQASQDTKKYTRKELLQLLQQELEACKRSDKVAVLGRYYANCTYSVYPVSILEDFIETRFADVNISIPREYEKCLIADYGKQFLLLPYEMQRQHVGVYLNGCHCSIGTLKCIDSPIDLENILLVGEISLMLKYIEEDGYSHKRLDAIDEAGLIQGRIMHGVYFLPDELNMYTGEDITSYDAVVICTKLYMQYVNKLKKIADYYIYLN